MSAVLQFDGDRHEYSIAGRRIIHVTEVLDYFDTGLRRVDPQVLAAAGALGTAVHKACELDDLGQLDESSVAPEVGARLEQWRKFCQDKRFAPIAVEARVYHAAYDFAGTFDACGVLDNCLSMIDRKTGIVRRSAGPQTAAYKAAYEHQVCQKIYKRFSVHLDPDRYFLVPHTGSNDWPVFIGMLNTYRWLTENP